MNALKVRLSEELSYRAKNCAEAIREPLTEFARLCRLQHLRGTFADVAVSNGLAMATGKDSTPFTFPRPDADCSAADLRQAIALGVLYAEPRNPRPFITTKQADLDYLLGKGEGR